MQRRPPPASVTSALAFLLSVLFSLPVAADLRGHGGVVKGVAVSPDGRRVLSASFDYSLILWDLRAQADLAHLVGHEGSVNAVAFLPDGRHAVSGGDDGAVISWNPATGKGRHRFPGHPGKGGGGAGW